MTREELISKRLKARVEGMFARTIAKTSVGQGKMGASVGRLDSRLKRASAVI